MRLREVEVGDSIFRRLLIRFISFVAGMRLPDAARVAWYRKDFFGEPLGAWTHAAMRGPSDWTIGERELMAAVVSKWNGCAFCVGAHGAVASKGMPAQIVEAALVDPESSGLSEELRATLSFLKKLTLHPRELGRGDADAVLAAGVSFSALTDAIAVACLFNVINRYADALDFSVPDDGDMQRGADMLLKRGYQV